MQPAIAFRDKNPFFVKIKGSIPIGIPPVRLSRKYIKIHWWDYALPAIGLPVWIFLTFAEVGKTASLSNMVIEILIVLAISVIIPWARFMILYSNKNFAAVIYQIMYLIPFSQLF